MFVLLRRFLVVAALMFWSGGFVFYASVVVPVGTSVLGNPREQGFITRHVAYWINVSGAVALLPLGWDALTHDPSPWRRRLRGFLWLIMLACLVVLFFLLNRMNLLLEVTPGNRKLVLDDALFYTFHRCYLWIITVQWVCSVGFVLSSLSAWHRQSRSNLG